MVNPTIFFLLIAMDSSFFAAVIAGKVEPILKLLSESKDGRINVTDDKGDSALIHCVKYTKDNIINITQILLDHGEKWDATDSEGNTVLHIAAKDRNIDVAFIIFFLNYGRISGQLKLFINLKNHAFKTALTIAIEANRPDIYNCLLDRDVIEPIGMDILAAVEGNDHDLVKTLLDRGVDWKATTSVFSDGETVLHRIARSGQLAFLLHLTNFFYEKAIDKEDQKKFFNQKNIHNETALTVAIKSRTFAMFEYLLTLDIIDPLETDIILSLKNDKPLLARSLLRPGLVLGAELLEKTLLYYVAEAGNLEFMRELLAFMDLSNAESIKRNIGRWQEYVNRLFNKNSFSALDIAIYHQAHEITNLLLKIVKPSIYTVEAAIYAGGYELFIRLLSSEEAPSIYEPQQERVSIVHSAVNHPNIQFLEYLINNYKFAHIPEKKLFFNVQHHNRNALTLAIELHNDKAITLLLDKKLIQPTFADVQACVRISDYTLLQKLIESNVEWKKNTSGDHTVLHNAVLAEQLNFVFFILKSPKAYFDSAESRIEFINRDTNKSESALTIAMIRKDMGIIKLLLNEPEIIINDRDLEFAIRSRSLSLVKRIQQMKNINFNDILPEYGVIPLHIAIHKDVSLEIIQYIMSETADINGVDADVRQ